MIESGELLVGRGGELSTLAALVDDVGGGRGRAVLLVGEAGIGKTRLAEAAAERAAARGFTVAWGRCPDSEAPPYWPWSQALGGLLGAEVGSLFEDEQRGVRAVLFAAVVDALDRATDGRPAAIILEDVHWADASSLALLGFVVGALPGLSVLLVLTARDDPLELREDTEASLARLPPAVLRLAVGGLDEAATAALVNHVAGGGAPAALVTEVHHRTGGNPFFVIEVARLHALRGERAVFDVPLGVHQVLSRRLARLSQPAFQLLGAAAVVGEPDVALLAAVTIKAPEQVLALLDAAVRARLVVSQATGFTFAHALVRETLYEDQSPLRRAELHRRTAEALEAQTAAPETPGPDDRAGRLATHWARAPGAEARRRGAAYALEAARGAMARLGYEQALRYYRWALDGGAGDHLGVLVELGEAQVLAGELTAGRRVLRETAEAAIGQGRAEDVARAVLAMGTGVGGFEVDVWDQHQSRLLEAALTSLRPGDGSLRAAVLARLSLARAYRSSLDERAALAREAVEMARRLGDVRVEVSALAAACDALSGPDHVAERLANAERMVQLAGAVDDAELVLLARRFRLVALLERGDLAGVDAEIAAYARSADRLRLPLYAWPVPIWRAMRALMDGDVATAWRLSEEADALAHQADSANAHMMVFTLRIAIARARGTPTDVLPDVEELVAHPDYPDAHGGPGADAFVAAFLAEVGQLDRGRRHLRRLLAGGLERVPRDCEWLEYVWQMGGAALLLDEPEAARLALDALTPYADLWAVDGVGGACFGVVAHQLARLAGHLGRPDEARRLSDRAVADYRAAGASWLAEQVGNVPPVAPAHQDGALEGEFRRAGPVWHLSFRGEEATVPHSKGMGDLATLLAHPGREVHVLDLVEAAGGPPATAAGGSHGAALDARARAAYRARLTELEEDLPDAEAHGDVGRATKLRAERDFLAAELGAALGLGGRARPAGDRVERARKAVSMRIATALRVVEAAHPALGRHLRLAVETGRFCVYRPEHPTRWRT